MINLTKNSSIFWSLIAVVFLSFPSLAQIDNTGGPVTIDSEHAEVIDENRLGIWTGNVRVVQGDSKLNADSVAVYFIENHSGEGWGDIARIEAKGDVRYITPKERARGNKATYDILTDTITFEGDVAVTVGDQEGVITGERLFIEVGKGRSTMSNNAQSGERVRAVITPRNDQNSSQ